MKPPKKASTPAKKLFQSKKGKPSDTPPAAPAASPAPLKPQKEMPGGMASSLAKMLGGGSYE